MTADDGAQRTDGEDLGMTEPGLIDGETREPATPVAVGPGPADPPALVDPGDASLLALVDRLTSLLEASDLAELEVASGATTIVLRSPAAVAGAAPAPAPAAADPAAAPDAAPGSQVAAPAAVATAERPSVKAPLTGIFYGSPSPGATAYVAVGNHVAVGQIIGLIEAMKLFNEIKSDLAGRVVRVCAESGALVKAKQPLIEVEPA
jgi:acetyl-CoA carboxylase biotin carboxyl carrier protein